LIATTPPVNNTARLPIVLVTEVAKLTWSLSSPGYPYFYWLNTSLTFEYLDNPNFTDITPTNHLTV